MALLIGIRPQYTYSAYLMSIALHSFWYCFSFQGPWLERKTISQWQVISWTAVLSCMFCNSQACASRFFSAYVWFPLSLICLSLCKISFFTLFVYLKSNQFCCWWAFNFELHLSLWSTLLDFDFINLMNWVLLSGRCELACRENDQGQWTSRCSSTELNLQTNEMSF